VRFPEQVSRNFRLAFFRGVYFFRVVFGFLMVFRFAAPHPQVLFFLRGSDTI